MMSLLEMSTLLLVSLYLLELSTGMVVLPRPPSSPNHINRHSKISDHETYNGKPWRSQNTEAEKPETGNYKFVEIELRGDNVNTLRFRKIFREVFGSESIGAEASKPKLIESKFGENRLGAGVNYHSSHSKSIDNDNGSTNFGQPDADRNVEKLYYLKHEKSIALPAVGSVGEKPVFKTESTSYDAGGYLKPASRSLNPSIHSEKLFVTKSFHPKKFKPNHEIPTTSQGSTYQEIGDADRMIFNDNNPNENNYDVTQSFEGIRTTENPWVTSSELPKQIPAPPSRGPTQFVFAQTTPVHKFYVSNRSEVLPGISTF